MPRPAAFANARFVRNVPEEAVSIQAERIATMVDLTADDVRTLVVNDLSIEVRRSNHASRGMYL